MTAQSDAADTPGVGFGGAGAWRCLGDDGALADLRRRMARGRPAIPACAFTCSDVTSWHTYAYGLRKLLLVYHLCRTQSSATSATAFFVL